jgi:hypothetical protein
LIGVVRVECYGGDYEHTLHLAGNSDEFDIRYNTAPRLAHFLHDQKFIARLPDLNRLFAPGA